MTEVSEESILEGRISVLAALRGSSRPIHVIYLDAERDRRETAPVVTVARAHNVPVERVDREFIDERAEGKRHGGMIAVVGQRRFVALPALLQGAAPAFIVMIDGVEDPYNFGSALRSLYAAGASGLVVRPRNWMSAAAIVARASAGASELMPTAIAETADEAADFCEAGGLSVACAATEDAVSMYQANLAVPLFLLIGGEQRGITRSFLRRATLRLRVPYARPGAPPLGTAAAAAVLGFEIARQRGLG